ncbi:MULTISPECIES: Sir2 family NAD+-dependent deacetylase [unclassified Oceanispirochaeta]|uniref:Sir2 family NAD+-dependent deacetylase n=1 Tax=unclassified Oceanispirochaeta TaxID=2635722 RepID=UPI000E09664A|nr:MULTISPECIES: Sir2 family NAD+-dependent deacetylase [unclassified Oceanispirochaeta]MBF9017377.1 NAD-dependent protein deacylase [Oceanispirochaeta sp. M2]NPD73752.1 NAD-dependent protein deacylase [Oceanispirochaeta sp. M1]RDG30504.1 NAD-dependent protein deacylase [Oceanispirochaeta sp. M1]
MNGSIVILTGAGISAESGIQTFRASDGLWENHRVEDVATPEGFARDPEHVQEFYNQRRRQLRDSDIKPHAAHMALGKLELEYDGSVTVITQNIDNLHEAGGSHRIIHMHGELLKSLCSACGNRADLEGDLDRTMSCRVCGASGSLRPDVVWFGEMPYGMDEIMQLLEDSSLFLSIGTSGHVYPAAGFVETAAAAGALTIEINLEPSLVHTLFDEHRTGKAGDLVPLLVDDILSGKIKI